MIVRIAVFLLLSASLLAQEGPFFGPPVPNGEVPARERLARAPPRREQGAAELADLLGRICRASGTAC